MKNIDSKSLYEAKKGNRVFISMHEVTYEHNGRQSPYFMVTRGPCIVPHHEKKSDAVVVCATYEENGEKKLLMASEFRVPIGTRELGFPAGLIDEKDYEGGVDQREAAIRAAIREVKEETGMDLEVTDVSPPNLYSSAGLTDESITYVFGKVTGTVSKAGLEGGEDIEVMLISQRQAVVLVNESMPELAHSKTAWPFLFSFSKGNL